MLNFSSQNFNSRSEKVGVNQFKIPILDLKPQYESLKEEIQEAIARILESGQFIMGPDVKLFEQEVAAYLGIKYAIGVTGAWRRVRG
jgi:hypothetical protein